MLAKEAMYQMVRTFLFQAVKPNCCGSPAKMRILTVGVSLPFPPFLPSPPSTAAVVYACSNVGKKQGIRSDLTSYSCVLRFDDRRYNIQSLHLPVFFDVF